VRAETTAYGAAGAAGVLVAPEAGTPVAAAPPKGRGARPASPGHRRDIQGLRAIAVITVIADHAGVGFLAGGYVGVDVFFVLSGFLITSLLVREAERSGRIGLLGFYARRARRILPAATVVLVATLAFTAAQLSYTRVQQVTTDVGWASAFLANVRFSTLGTDYFAEGLPPSPVQHYWSLAVEEQFYLVWPLLLLGLVLLARRRSAGRTHLHLGLAVAVVAVLSVASFTWSLHLTGDNQTTAYFSSAGRAWELGIGALLAVAASRLRGTTAWVRWVLAAGGLAAVLTAVVAFDATTRFPGWAVLLPVLGTAAVIAAGIGTDAVGPARVLVARPLTWVGDISYSWYLWHWPVLVLWGARETGGVSGRETAVLVAVSLLLAVASYHLVENPLRRNRWLGARHRRALVLWPVALAMVVGAVFGARLLSEHRLAHRFDANAQYLALRDEHLPVPAQLQTSLEQADAADPVAFPLTDVDMVGALSEDLWNSRYDCSATHDESQADLCPVGAPDGDRLIVVIGDSHMGQWLPALDTIGQEGGYRVLPLVKYGCAPYDVPLRTGGRSYTECQDFRDWALQQVTQLKPDVVVIGGRGLQGNMAVPVGERPDVWTAGVAATIQTLAPLTSRLIVVGDVPALDVDPIGCLTDARATMATCTTPVDPRTPEANRLTSAAARGAGVPFLDLSDLACLRGRCPAVAGGLMVYANADHLSMAWVRHVTPEVRSRLGLS
jgi:peptidoglycan/LPS O-acetylase OafA/YrhL